MRVFIGLTGVKTSGKTTAFNFLKEQFPEIQEVMLAKKLKDVCAECLEFERDCLELPELKEKEFYIPVELDQKNLENIFKSFNLIVEFDKHVRPHIGKVLHTPRKVAQYIGTEVLRSVVNSIHCDSAIDSLPTEGIFVITDIRFIDEFDYFKTGYPTSFFPMHIQNRIAEMNVDDHPSEKQVLDIAKRCETIDNNGTLENLKVNITKAFESSLRTVSIYGGVRQGAT